MTRCGKTSQMQEAASRLCCAEVEGEGKEKGEGRGEGTLG